METPNFENILKKHVVNYLKPSFPHYNYDELYAKYTVLWKEKSCVIDAMKEVWNLAIEKAA